MRTRLAIATRKTIAVGSLQPEMMEEDEVLGVSSAAELTERTKVPSSRGRRGEPRQWVAVRMVVSEKMGWWILDIDMLGVWGVLLTGWMELVSVPVAI